MPVWSLSEDLVFPHPLTASDNGILAIGGDLSEERLKLSYTYGIFPWYSDDSPVLWWFPDPRCVMKPTDIVISKSMRSLLRKSPFLVTCDTAFEDVMMHCRYIPRLGQDGTWILPEMVEAYTALHESGYAHSVEIWQEGELVGGLYGVALGGVFFGESMFSLVPNTSKYALILLAEFLQKNEFILIDCQEDTAHMRKMGAGLMPAADFHEVLKKNRLMGVSPGKWTYDQPPVHL